MTPLEFFDLFMAELPLYESGHIINTYYKFARQGPLYGWRKAYFIQRLEYIYSAIVKDRISDDLIVWDVGCGFGTSALFLAMNGIKTIGSTLEFYHKIIPERKKYWQKYGNTELFSYKIENLFETTYAEKTFDYILVQDTLHHIEPIEKGISFLYRNLKDNGKLVVVDENGNNILLRALLYKMRGNKRIVKIFDENLGQYVVFGNENVRSLEDWERIVRDEGFSISDVEYIKFLPPYIMNENNYRKLNLIEQELWKKYAVLRKWFFWGLNFIGSKQTLI